MDIMSIERHGLIFEVDPHTDKYGHNRVTVHVGEFNISGEIPGCLNQAYPRIEFRWIGQAAMAALAPHADHRYITLDQEYDDDGAGREPDFCTFDLTPQEAAAITAWREPPVGQPVRSIQIERDQGNAVSNITVHLDARAVAEAAGREIKRRQALRRDAQTQADPIIGIGGIGVFAENEMPVIPSAAAIERQIARESAAVRCRCCGSSSLDGAMFTTLGGQPICDDCV